MSEKQIKQFILRNIPAKVHHAWKLVAYMCDETMESFALQALNDRIKSQLKGLDLSGLQAKKTTTVENESEPTNVID